MVWLSVIGYFALWALAWPLILTCYAKVLLGIAGFPAIIRLFLGLLAYLAIVLLVGLCIITTAEIRSWHLAMKETKLFVVWFVAWFLMSFFPSLLFFKRRYLNKLERAGYFNPRKAE